MSLVVSRPSAVAGFKVGPTTPQRKGGFTYFGPDLANPDGHVVHRFWPYTHATGHITLHGQAKEIKGTGMFVHAIQGMRPNLIAKSWNFAWFTSTEHHGVSAIQMEFTSLPNYGKTGNGSGGVKVNIGSVVFHGKLALVTAETKWPDHEYSPTAEYKSRALHYQPQHDADTGYDQPTALEFVWAGKSIQDPDDPISADLKMKVGFGKESIGLVEKVDVLAEIPKVLKAVVNLTGTKPYIYQVSTYIL